MDLSIGATRIESLRRYKQTQSDQLKQHIEDQTNKIWTLYESYLHAITSLPENKLYEEAFHKYWEEKEGDAKLTLATTIAQQLDKRATELECQDIAIRRTQNNSIHQDNYNQETFVQPFNSLAIEQRLLSSDLKVPEFHGNPAEFGPFWELFEELVHKRPYSNIGKLSILLGCCKGDAARSLRMIPRTGDAYERAIQPTQESIRRPQKNYHSSDPSTQINEGMSRRPAYSAKQLERCAGYNNYHTKTRRSN
ncbi:hypothetical protein OSTOST_02414 [Ostertagia ostertagi]